ncbi:ABC transporter substrate-binding protein [Microbacterium trichothecenolyticum]|uniref:Peptide/nickel transport system substrate-binding protein n=1 Tax=Microbacterium trichothecenolyticum TaxID=69370 RepID=A0ABU0TVL9_MICTR|nr:ABC transporter substrate-binding protein [Microbacterium trichothecenolyticum]MDQ1123717.1 peptide/nickel transport system substrate-binding protein [Microbacterium trichothecenolyticum]
MTTRRSTLAAALAVTAALALSACANTAAAPGADTASATPVQGGDLTFAVANDPISLNPSSTGSGNDTLYVTRQLVDSLLYQNPETGALDPWLATAYTSNADATEFTFSLRDDVTFSDGTPFTAANVKATFDDIVAAGALSQAVSSFVGYAGTDVVDDHTALVRFSSPNAAFPNSTASVALGIVGDATLAVPYDQRADGKAVVGTGPFTLKTYTKDTSTVLTAREDYAWAPAALGNDGRARLDSVTFQIVPEASVRTGSLTSDQVDVAGSVQPNDVASLEQAGYPLVWRGNPGISFGLSFNLSHPIVADLAVRQAIAAAVDAKTVRDTALNDYFAIATSALAATTPGYADESASFGYDPDRAAALLDAAGWTAGADGIREKDGQKLQLKLWWITNFGPNQTSLELIQQQLKAVGIDIQLQSGPVPDFLEAQKNGDFDIVWGNLSRADGDVLRTTFSKATTRYRIDDPTLEALLQKQLAISDPAARDEVLAEAQARIASQVYQIPVHELTSILGTRDAVHGVSLGADSRLDSLVAAWKSE